MSPDLLTILAQLLLAVTLGAVVSFSRRMDNYRLAMMQAHAFLAAAAAMFMIIIAGEIVRAVGLLGAASLIRYRYAMRSSKDASTLIIAMAIGMACGSQNYNLAILAGIFTVIVSYWFDSLHMVLPRTVMQHREIIELKIETSNYNHSIGRIREIATEHGMRFLVRSLSRRLSTKRGPTVEAVLRIVYDPSVDLSDLCEQLLDDFTFRVSWQGRRDDVR